MRDFLLDLPRIPAKMTTLSAILLLCSPWGAFAGPAREAASLANDTLAAAHASEAALACGDFAMCDNFESATPGGPPSPSLWTVGGANCTGTGVATVDASVAHRGKQSLKVTSTGGYCNHVFAATPIPASLGQRMFGRFFVRFADALGDGHVTFMAMKDAADNQRDLRMGGQSRILMWNRESDDATVPVLSPAGIALSVSPAAGEWHCVEFTVNGNKSTMKTWFQGAEVAGLHVDTTPTPEVDSQWLARGNWRPAPVDFRIGWESYAGQPMTLWFDDVALSKQRIRCN